MRQARTQISVTVPNTLSDAPINQFGSARAVATAATKSVVAHRGWFVPYADTANVGTDYNFRAVIAVNGLAANVPAEAMYIVGALDSSLTALNGAHD